MGKIKDIIIEAHEKQIIDLEQGLEKIPPLSEIVKALENYKSHPPGGSYPLKQESEDDRS
jgi:hypothetical protein